MNPSAPSSEELIGLRYAAAPLYLTSEAIARFSTSTGAAPERFSGQPQVAHTIAASLTAPVQAKLLEDPQVGIELARTMHTEQQITVHAPILADVGYQAEATITAVRETAAGRMISFSTTVRDPEDRIVQELTTTLLTAPADAARDSEAEK